MLHLVRTSDGKYLGQSKLRKNFPDTLPPGTELLDIPDGEEKGVWDEANKRFNPKTPAPKRIPSTEFLKRFTLTELRALVFASRSNVDAYLLLYMMQFNGGLVIELTQDVRDILDSLETSNVLTAGRAEQIFNG